MGHTEQVSRVDPLSAGSEFPLSPGDDGRPPGEQAGPEAAGGTVGPEDDGDGSQSAARAAWPDWLVLVYRIPSEPSRHRAAVWRRLRRLGAVYLQSSVAAVPATPALERSLRALRREIVESMGGWAVLLRGEALAGAAEIAGVLTAARDEDYEEILDRCRDFHAGLEKEEAAGHFTYGELEENEHDVARLRAWFDGVRARDVLGATKASQVEAALSECERALERFAARVYEAEEH